MIDDIKVKSFYDDGFVVWDFLSIKTIKIRFPKLLKGEKPDAVGLIINGELSDYLLDDKAISFLKQYRAHLEARDKLSNINTLIKEWEEYALVKDDSESGSYVVTVNCKETIHKDLPQGLNPDIIPDLERLVRLSRANGDGADVCGDCGMSYILKDGCCCQYVDD